MIQRDITESELNEKNFIFFNTIETLYHNIILITKNVICVFVDILSIFD